MGVIEGDTRSLDYGTYGFGYCIKKKNMYPIVDLLKGNYNSKSNIWGVCRDI